MPGTLFYQQPFGRGEKGGSDLSHAQNIKVYFKAYISETYTVTYGNDSYWSLGYVTSGFQNIFSLTLMRLTSV